MSRTLYRSDEQKHLGRIIPDLIRARRLLKNLVWKDIRIRYRYAVMGFVWAILEPVALMAILTFIFAFVLVDKSQLTGAHDPKVFAVTLLTGLIFWQFIADSIRTATQSLLNNENLVKKVYFTREVIPLSAMGNPLVNLIIGLVILLGIQLVLLGTTPGLSILFLPVLLGIQIIITAGLSLLFSCGNVHYRDIGYMVNVALLFGFYASPIFYELDLVLAVSDESLPKWAKLLYQANPMAGLITAYRAVLVDGVFPPLNLWAWPACFAVVSLVAGVVVFRRAAPTLSDHL